MTATPPTHGPKQDWRILLAIFWATSFVESLGISQVFALLPTYLREMGVPEADRLEFIGLFTSLLFIVGMPLVPLWGVWADKYSRKAVIVRSAVVEAIVYGGVALAREPWQVALCLLLVGFQLGNTGVMLAAIRDVAPVARLGAILGVFGASTAVGMAVGPTLAGVLIDGLGWEIAAVFGLSAILSIGTALLVALGSKEVRPEVVPEGRVLTLAYGAVRGVLGDPAVRRIFVIFGISFLANQMTRPYLPVRVEDIVGIGPGLASSIALVMGTAALVGGLIGPLGGAAGDRIGFKRVLAAALAGGGTALVLMPFVPALTGLALLSVGFAAASSTISAMVFGLVATEVPSERRSATLNLVYLPLYAAGIIGPALGAIVVSGVGLVGPFILGGGLLLIGSVVVSLRRPSTASTEATAAT